MRFLVGLAIFILAVAYVEDPRKFVAGVVTIVEAVKGAVQ